MPCEPIDARWPALGRCRPACTATSRARRGVRRVARERAAPDPGGLVTVYIVLGVLYESYIHPITILSTLPSAGVGAFLALIVCRSEFTVIALIGIMLLIGIVKKNAIMMIDFALEAEREQGMSPREAIHKACLLRFRPIMMTTMAALLGGLPLALGTGTGAELRRPLGITIVGGLLLSQVLTLYTTPVIYLYMERLAARLRAPARPGAGTPAPPARGSGAMNISGAVHPPADRDVAAGGGGLLAGMRVPHPAGRAAAARRLPDHQRQRGAPGASPETMASSVATPLERRFGRIAGVTEMTSVSALGTTTITLQFDLDRDVDGAARDVQAAINAARRRAAPNLPTRPNYRKVNPADAPILILSLTSDDAAAGAGVRSGQQRARAEDLAGRGRRPGVRGRRAAAGRARAGRSGGARGRGTCRSRMSARALRHVDGEPAQGIVGGADVTLQRRGERPAASAPTRTARWSSRTRTAPPCGSATCATSSTTSRTTAWPAWIDGKRAVLMIIRRQPGANILETNERRQGASCPSSKQSISPAIDVDGGARSHADHPRVGRTTSSCTLVISMLLVTAVVFVFLRSVRATAIPSVAVPLSLVGTFGVMYLLGYSIDNLSLMALTISTGFVVDDAIVVTENIARLIEAGKPPLRAALEGARQIGFTIVSITVSLLAVFIPILFMGGIVGRLFREFAVTLSIAIARVGDRVADAHAR